MDENGNGIRRTQPMGTAVHAPPCRRAWSPTVLAGWLLALLLSTTASAQTGAQLCGNPFVNHFGPYDYRATTPASRKIVEDVHFTPGIESMTRAKNTQFHEMAGDVEYTLNVFPNHHRALITMDRLATRWKRDPPPGTRVSVDCWFDRAIRFRPDDTVARALYAQFLHRRQRTQDGLRQLHVAIEHAKDNPLSHYNIGLVALELGDHGMALKQAHTAMEMGYPRAELADRLKALGRWADPSPPSTDAAASSGTAPGASQPPQ